MNVRKDFKIEITGLPKSGKKTILKRIITDEKNMEMGDEAIRYFIKKERGDYYIESRKFRRAENIDDKDFLGFGLIHVVDISDSQILTEEYQERKKVEIKRLANMRKGCPLLLLASKKDKPNFLTCERLYTILELDKISSGMVSIIDCDAIHEMKHVKKGIDWLKKIMLRNFKKV